MKPIKNSWIFLFSILAGTSVVLCLAAYAHWKNPPIKLSQLTDDISVTEQVKQEQMNDLKDRGFKTVIDLRPDGEASDQPTSDDMSSAAKANGIKFYYVPVPHGAIPPCFLSPAHTGILLAV